MSIKTSPRKQWLQGRRTLFLIFENVEGEVHLGFHWNSTQMTDRSIGEINNNGEHETLRRVVRELTVMGEEGAQTKDTFQWSVLWMTAIRKHWTFGRTVLPISYPGIMSQTFNYFKLIFIIRFLHKSKAACARMAYTKKWPCGCLISPPSALPYQLWAPILRSFPSRSNVLKHFQEHTSQPRNYN